MGAPGGALPIRPGPGLSDGLIIPASELVERFSRSPGPGGQSVNTSHTRVELEYDVAASSALTETQRRRTPDALGNRPVDGTIDRQSRVLERRCRSDYTSVVPVALKIQTTNKNNTLTTTT